MQAISVPFAVRDCLFFMCRVILCGRKEAIALRVEEMSAQELRESTAFHDTILFTFCGMTQRPSHLPIGSSWFIVRKVRDTLEKRLGGRVLTVPVQGVDLADDADTFFSITHEQFSFLLQQSITAFTRYLPIKYAVLLSDSVHKEQAFFDAFSDASMKTASFVWWRDGLDLTFDTYIPSGEQDTSLMLTIAKGLVDVDQKSADHLNANRATAQAGEKYLQQVSDRLQMAVETLWEQKY